jgi:hypothetical protein
MFTKTRRPTKAREYRESRIFTTLYPDFSMDQIVYTNRLSAFEKAITYTLRDHLTSSAGLDVPYPEISKIHLKYQPTKHYSNLYYCEVYVRGKMVARLSNRRFEGINNFSYHDQDYRLFVKSLHKQLDSKKVRLVAGFDPGRYWLELVLSVVFLPLMGVAIGMLQPVLGILFGLVIVLRLVPYFKRNAPKIYETSHIPARVLPD